MTDRDAWKYPKHGGSAIYDDDGKHTKYHPDYGMPASNLGWRSFIAQCILHEIWKDQFESKILKEIEKWKKDQRNLKLYEYLGLTEHEYNAWIDKRSTIIQIVEARRFEMESR